MRKNCVRKCTCCVLMLDALICHQILDGLTTATRSCNTVIVDTSLMGLSAAITLNFAGHYLLVLKAHNRVGGQTHSVLLGGGEDQDNGPLLTGARSR